MIDEYYKDKLFSKAPAKSYIQKLRSTKTILIGALLFESGDSRNATYQVGIQLGKSGGTIDLKPEAIISVDWASIKTVPAKIV